jgi:hypothetical protein
MSRTTLRVVRAAITVLLVCAGPGARAQETGIVPLGHPAYADVDRLVDLGVLDDVVVGQRPYSRRELRRLYARLARRYDESRVRADSAGTRPLVPAAVEAIARLRMHLGAILDADPEPLDGLLDAARLTAGSTDALRRGFSGTLTRTVEATIDPLAERRLGALVPPGQSLAVELAHRAEPMPWLAFNLGERFEGSTAARGEPARARAELLLGGVRARYRNVAVQVGREQAGWAQRPGDGLLIASDAPALDMASLSGDTPFLLPGLLRHLGPTQATILLADLGASVARSHSKLLAYKVSILPRPEVELGAFFLNHYGGEGGRASSLGNRLIDFLPFVDIFRTHNYTDTTRTLDVDSDKQLGIDGRVRLDALGGLVVTTELLIDDFDVHRIHSLFVWDGAQSLSLVLPQIARSAFSAEVSAKHTGVRTYTHGSVANGITTRGRLLGDELGPDAKAFAASGRWLPAGPTRVAVEMRSAIYSRADYETIEQGDHFVIRRVGAASNEVRDGVALILEHDVRPALALLVRAAGERIRNAGFTGVTRRDYAASVTLRLTR